MLWSLEIITDQKFIKTIEIPEFLRQTISYNSTKSLQFIENISSLSEKGLISAEHTKIINLVDIYERTQEEICYSWNNMKNIVINSFNMKALATAKIHNAELLESNVYYKKGCIQVHLDSFFRYDTIFKCAVNCLSKMGYDSIIINNDVLFVSNKPYTKI